MGPYIKRLLLDLLNSLQDGTYIKRLLLDLLNTSQDGTVYKEAITRPIE